MLFRSTGVVPHGKFVVDIYIKTPYRALCCALIVYEGGKVCFQTPGAWNVQSHSNVHHHAKFKAGIYFLTPKENISHYFPVDNMVLFESHRDAIETFLRAWCTI